MMRRFSFAVVVATALWLQQTVETGVGLTTGEKDDETNRQTLICSGTLISSTFVLSSAYCTSSLMTTVKSNLDGSSLIAYWKTPRNSVKYHRTISVHPHPLYNKVTRISDLSLVKLKKPFKHVEHFVGLSPRTLKSDVELNCVIVGIGAPHERGYKVPVRVKYGRTACRIPKSNPSLEFVIGYTWADFLCAETIGPGVTRLPCDRSDPLLCSSGRHQYGIFSYGYDGTDASLATIECGDSAVQGRLLFVNRHAGWISDTMTKEGDDDGSWQFGKNGRTTTRHRHTTQPRSTTNSTQAAVPHVTSTARPVRPEIDYPYLVYLEGRFDEPVCGGTLITPWHVLTTAYCTTRMTEIVVTVTAHHRQHANARLVYIHPDFDSYTLTADISIVVLREPLNVIRYAQLPDIISDPINDNSTTKALNCVVVARRWMTPYYITVNVMYGLKACRESFDSEIQTTVNKTWREFICGMPNQELRNDTGDPLICNGFQYGIISHAYRTKMQASETGSIDHQVRFLIVDYHREWIYGVIAADNQIDTNDGSPYAFPRLLISLVLPLLTIVLQLLSQLR
ncbi:uncharacterized protein LOC126551256 isoform X2 [Aphis gossypii]|uniref:uncharacterized protein LOC126551256 isoform X2 n=1 Tax=Aphis gossypii TaxID=80765 RepID=UPI002158D330|nr:uncharacterized protein LOC126551256 isoform X2 [Aphis gossypii]XP_050060098.1 uncharacterized protein LOC126551256 isoform X2 [Aphis gossypii]